LGCFLSVRNASFFVRREKPPPPGRFLTRDLFLYLTAQGALPPLQRRVLLDRFPAPPFESPVNSPLFICRLMCPTVPSETINRVKLFCFPPFGWIFIGMHPRGVWVVLPSSFLGLKIFSALSPPIRGESAFGKGISFFRSSPSLRPSLGFSSRAVAFLEALVSANVVFSASDSRGGVSKPLLFGLPFPPPPSQLRFRGHARTTEQSFFFLAFTFFFERELLLKHPSHPLAPPPPSREVSAVGFVRIFNSNTNSNFVDHSPRRPPPTRK